MRPVAFRALLAALVMTVILAGSASAEEVWVKSESAEIRSGKAAVFPVLVTAKKGDQLTVLAREGKWIKVKVGDKDGYVYETALSTTKVGSGGNLLSALGAGGADMTTASAAKGLDKSAETYAASKNLDPRPLQALVDSAKAIDPKEWQAFTAAGKVGPDAPAAGGS
jgi:uncharacterized protein YgiM (DUF1202 family)